MEYLEDYDFTLEYHPGKANVVADTLSRKNRGTVACLAMSEWKMLELGHFNVQLDGLEGRATLFTLVEQPTLLKRVIDAQQSDDEAKSYLTLISSVMPSEGWTFDSDQDLKFRGRSFVPTSYREDVLREFHHSKLAVHPGSTKMYHDLRRQYWWKGMK